LLNHVAIDTYLLNRPAGTNASTFVSFALLSFRRARGGAILSKYRNGPSNAFYRFNTGNFRALLSDCLQENLGI